MHSAVRKGKIILKVILVLACILVFAAAAFAGYFYFSLSNMNNSNGEILDAVSVSKNDPVNILLLGTDIGTEGSKSADDPKRTDTMILVHYIPEEKKAVLVSIPRDTLIKLKLKSGRLRNAKINEANADYGTSGAVSAVQDLLNVQINYFIKIDYKAFRNIVDAVGGVDMEIKDNMNYDDTAQDLHIHFKKGETVHLDGEKAEEFFRWRKNNNGTGLATGDIGRIENEHIFIEKFIDKFKNIAVIPRIPSILTSVEKNVSTDIKPSMMIDYAIDLLKIDKSNVKMYTLKGTTPTIHGVSYFKYNPDLKENIEIMSEIEDNGQGTGQ